MKFILHSYRRCPFCIRARIILYLKGFEYEVVEEPLRKWTGWMQEWSADRNERPRVPVLRYIDETGIEFIMPESNEINFFLDRIDGNPQFTPVEGSTAYTEMVSWWTWCDRELKPLIDLYKYGKNRIWDKEENSVYSRELRDHLDRIEEHLKTHSYLVEDRLTLADIALIPFIRQIMRTRGGEFDFSPFPKLVLWANSILETPWFESEVMKKHPLAPVGQ